MSSQKNIINQATPVPGGISTIDTPTTTQQNEIVLWDGTNGKALKGSNVFIDNELLYAPPGVQFAQSAANPGNADAVWVNQANGHLYHGEDDLEELSLPASSQDRELVVFTGASGAVLDGSDVFISPDGLIYDAIGLEMMAGPANPSASESTLWIDSTLGHLHRGSVDIEAPQILTPASSTDNAIVRWNGTSGDDIQNSTVILGDNNRLAVGSKTLLFADPAHDSLIVGDHPLAAFTGQRNTIVGTNSGTTWASSVNFNTAIGAHVLENLTTGTNNIAIGASSGQAYSGNETGNILIGASGVEYENATTYIGSNQSRVFVAGVFGVTPMASGTAHQHVMVNEYGQLGSVATVGPAYSEYSATINTASPPGGSTTVKCTKVGKAVTVTLGAILMDVEPGLGGNLISFVGALPLAYRPTASLAWPMMTVSGGVYDTGLISSVIISGDGSIIINRDLDEDPANFHLGGIDYDVSFSFVGA